MIRITTGGVLKSYRYGLNNAFIRMNDSINTVMSTRNFSSYAEDPSAASQAFQVRRSIMRNQAQLTVCSSIKGKYDQAYDALSSARATLCEKTTDSTEYTWLRGGNDPTGDARPTLAKAFQAQAENLIQCMNSTYGNDFVFAGADGLNVPFELRDDGKLYYRGICVDTAVPDVLQDESGGLVTVDANGNYDAAGTNYLCSSNTYTMTQAEYDAATTFLTDPNNGGNNVMVDSDGNIDPAGDHQILVKQAEVVPMGDFATQDDVDNAFILRDATGAPVEVDANGNIVAAGAGGYYLSLENGGMVDSSYTPPSVLEDASGKAVMVNEDGVIPDDTTDATHYLVTTDAETCSIEDYEKAESDLAKLDYLSTEAYYLDIGLGFQWNNDTNSLITSSGFNAALQGINFVGYGVDEDGDPKNIISLMMRLGDMCANYTTEDGWDREEYDRLCTKFEAALQRFEDARIEQSANTTKLNSSYDLLDSKKYTLNIQLSELEDVDEAAAITDFLYAQYCYNAALKVGNSIMSPSLMDYLN